MSRRDDLKRGKGILDALLAALSHEDEFAVIVLGDPPRVLVDFARDRQLASQAVAQLAAGGPTPLYDAIYCAAGRLKTKPRDRRKVAVVISDGEDNTSRRSASQLDDITDRPDILVYGVGPAPRISRLDNPLIALAGRSGGRYLDGGSPNVGLRIAREIELANPSGHSRPKVICRPGYKPA